MQNGALDLILSDINMPVMKGLQFLQRLRGLENAKGMPVEMITTEGNESRVVEALSAGARSYIRKVKERIGPLLNGGR